MSKNEINEIQVIHAIWGVVGSFIGLGLGVSVHYNASNLIPSISTVQTGFVVPNKLEIKCQDLDGNGQKETILRYEGENYLLTLDEQGRPRVQAYELKYTTS